VDFRHTGVVRKVDVEGIRAQLDNRNIVVVSPLGFSPTGEAFNIAMEEVAATIAGALKAEKFILLSNVDGVRRFDEVVTELTTDQAKDLMDKRLVDDEDIYNLRYAIQALKKGCRRVHILPYFVDGAILAELFTHDGIGTMVTEENMDSIRDATSEDINGLIQLLEPLEEDGTLVKRPREKLEREIDRYTLLEHDGVIYGSAALYPFPAEKIGEMGALVVNSTYQGSGDGERLLHHIENKARRMGLNKLFVLTTRTAHWFLKRGFKPATIDDLPVAKRELYNWQRRSQIFIKDL
jgi:amino-acid N-acetyltransferase